MQPFQYPCDTYGLCRPEEVCETGRTQLFVQILASVLIHLLVVLALINLNRHPPGMPDSEEKVIEVELISTFGVKNSICTQKIREKTNFSEPTKTSPSYRSPQKTIRHEKKVVSTRGVRLTESHKAIKNSVDADSGGSPDSKPVNRSVESGPPAGVKKASAFKDDHTAGNASQQYVAENFYYIQALITKHLSYPPIARRMKWQGVVVVTFVVSENGMVEQIKVVSSSGHSMLDKNVIATIKSVQPFPEPPVKAELKMPIKFVLTH